jgi:hypothetical protein
LMIRLMIGAGPSAWARAVFSPAQRCHREIELAASLHSLQVSLIAQIFRGIHGILTLHIALQSTQPAAAR